MELFAVAERKTLRSYQHQACDAVEEAWEAGKKPLITMATGTGKTIIFAELVRRELERGKRSLVLAHREELVDQAIDKISGHAGYTPDKEMASNWAALTSKVVIGSVPTMQRVRLGRWAPNHFDMLTVDEAHHVVSKTYRNILDHFTEAHILGVTATADRADDRQLGDVFDVVAYDYPLHKAINEGYLVKIIGKRCKDFSIDLSQLKVVAGDFMDNDLAEVIEKYIAPIAHNVQKETAGIPTLCFLPNVESSRIMAEELNKIGVKAGYISGAMNKDDRRNTLYNYKAGNITHLCSCNVLLEGYDEPKTAAIVMLRPTGSRTVFAQAVGRGTRLYPGKEELLLVEFTFNSEKLRLVTAYELFSSMGYGASVQERAAKKAAANEEEDFMANLQKAHEEQYNTRDIIKRMAVPTWGFVEFDPLEIGNLMNIDIEKEFDVSYKGRRLEGPATHKQLEMLSRYGIAKLDTLDKAQASVLIDSFMSKGIYPSTGYASESQKLLLVRLGFKDVENLKKAQASLLINELKRARWEERQ